MVIEAQVDWSVGIAVSGAGCITPDGRYTAPHSGVGPSELLDGTWVGYPLTRVSVAGTRFGCAATKAWCTRVRVGWWIPRRAWCSSWCGGRDVLGRHGGQQVEGALHHHIVEVLEAGQRQMATSVNASEVGGHLQLHPS